ncbi:hypothetical protein K461DRAFT_282050 [Myriangium duriaei CBS 260.36]|uniref:Uncharacterized protein n=1 Tax=Myriangium duriaei CBS 260.36 TaxID=1168546 RepID=A0A9P4MJC3_9PEZI|nr:hypothetical protein K461DRAFT_282050 [Myriangium duriaei CBS 260.36]
MLLFGLGLFFGRRSLRARKAATQAAPAPETTCSYTNSHYSPSYQRSPLTAETAAYYSNSPAELGNAGARQELGGETATQELDSHHTRHEMPATSKQ